MTEAIALKHLNSGQTEIFELLIPYKHSFNGWLLSNIIFSFAVCAAGYSNLINHVQHDTCMPCPRGTYSEREGGGCNLCPHGTTTMDTGSTSSDDCNGESFGYFKCKVYFMNKMFFCALLYVFQSWRMTNRLWVVKIVGCKKWNFSEKVWQHNNKMTINL